MLAWCHVGVLYILLSQGRVDPRRLVISSLYSPSIGGYAGMVSRLHIVMLAIMGLT